MNPFKKTSKEKKEAIKYWIDKGLNQNQTAKQLGISRQLVRYWVLKMRDK
jgi:transposase-like protein